MWPFVLAALACLSGARAQWDLLSLEPDSPLLYPRNGAAGTYCQDVDSFVIFGGLKSDQLTSFNDMWTFNFTANAWTSVSVLQPPSVPSARVWTTLVTNQIEGQPGNTTGCQVVLYGGSIIDPMTGNTVAESSELWVGDLDYSVAGNPTVNWTMVSLPGESLGPGQVTEHSAVWLRDHMYVFGGMTISADGYYGTNYATLWKLTLSGSASTGFAHLWEQIAASGATNSAWPPARFGAVMSAQVGNSADDDDHLFVFGGRSLPTSGQLVNYNMMGDVWVYSMERSIWYQAQGVSLQRTNLGSAVYGGAFYAFGGFTRVVENTRSSLYVFNDLLVTSFTNVSSSTLTDSAYPICTASDGRTGLWCDAVFNDIEPDVRYDFAYCTRRNQFVVFGGKFNNFFTDTWALNMTLTLNNLVVAPPDDLGGGDLQSTMYFMIAILTMMVICFFVFVASLRRQRYNNVVTLIGARGQGVRPRRPVGARPEVVAALPTKRYHKASPNDAPASGDGDAENQIIEPEDGLHDMCAICLGDYDEGVELRVLPCAHFFHPQCIDQWLSQHNACPMCKAPVDTLNPAFFMDEQGVPMVAMPGAGVAAVAAESPPAAAAAEPNESMVTVPVQASPESRPPERVEDPPAVSSIL